METSEFQIEADLRNASETPKPRRGRPRKAPGEAAGTRREHDHYDTDPALALAFVRWCATYLEKRYIDAPLVLDPMAGGGPYVAAARAVYPGAKIAAVDIREECRAACEAAGATTFHHADALTLPSRAISAVDLIVTNPSFKDADRLVRHFWPHMKPGASLALLLSVTFLGTEDRWETDEADPGLFIIAPPSFVVPIVPRPEFTGTSPKFEAALYAWTKGGGDGVIRGMPSTYGCSGALIPREPLRWEKPRKPRKPRAPRAAVAEGESASAPAAALPAPETMHGAGDQQGGEDFPAADPFAALL